MAADAEKAADKTMEQSDNMASSTKKAVLDKTKNFVKQTTAESKQYVDEALAKVVLLMFLIHCTIWFLVLHHESLSFTQVRGKTWSEPLGKACAVTGGIVSGMGNFVPGLGIVGGALSMGSKVLNPAATINDVRREQVIIVPWEVNPLIGQKMLCPVSRKTQVPVN